MEGCQGSINDFADGCAVLLPIAAWKDHTGDTCQRPVPNNNMCVVTWGAFQLFKGTGTPQGCNANNCHIGRLLGPVLVTEGRGISWTPGVIRPLVVRLVQ